MRVMVTGGTGFVGFHTVLALQEAGHQIRLLVRSSEKMRRVFGSRGPAGLDFVSGDITDEPSVEEALEGCDAVVHSAAMVSVHASDSDRVLWNNLRGTELVLGGAWRRGIERMVQVSSTAALFRRGAAKVDGESPLGVALSGYGRSKIECDRYVRAAQARGARIYTTYPGSVIGPDDPGVSEAIGGLKIFLDTRSVPLTSSGIQLIDARDLALAHVRLLERGGPPARFTIGGHFLPWPDFADLLEEITGVHFVRLPTPGLAMRLAGRVGDLINRFVPLDLPLSREAMTYATEWVEADDSRAQDEIGLVYRDVRESLRDTIRWMQDTGLLWLRYRV